MSSVTLAQVKELIQELEDEIPNIHASLHHDHCRVRMNDTGKEDAYQLLLKDLAEKRLDSAMKALPNAN